MTTGAAITAGRVKGIIKMIIGIEIRAAGTVVASGSHNRQGRQQKLISSGR